MRHAIAGEVRKRFSSDIAKLGRVTVLVAHADTTTLRAIGRALRALRVSAEVVSVRAARRAKELAGPVERAARALSVAGDGDKGAANGSSAQDRRYSARLQEFSREFGLSRRQRDVVGLRVVGYRTKHIAAELRLSEHTVDEHLRNAKKKIGIQDGDEIVRLFHCGWRAIRS